MNAAFKFLIIPVFVVSMFAVLITNVQANTSGADIKISTTYHSFVSTKGVNPASDLATALRTDANVIGVIGGNSNAVAIIFKAEPEAGKLAAVCTAAEANGFVTIHQIISGSVGHNLTAICQ